MTSIFEGQPPKKKAFFRTTKQGSSNHQRVPIYSWVVVSGPITDSATLGLGCRRSQWKAACQSQSRSSEYITPFGRAQNGEAGERWRNTKVLVDVVLNLLMGLGIPATIDVFGVVFFVIDLTYACISIHVEISVDLIWSLNMFMSLSIHL